MENVFSLNTIVVADTQQVTGDLPDGDVVVLSLKEGVYYGLNEVGGRIWHLIQQPISVGEIQNILLQEFDVDADQCFEEIVVLLGELASKKLIQINP